MPPVDSVVSFLVPTRAAPSPNRIAPSLKISDVGLDDHHDPTLMLPRRTHLNGYVHPLVTGVILVFGGRGDYLYRA